MTTVSKILFALAFATSLSLSGCAALDKVVSVIDPVTGEASETTVGEMAAGVVDSVGSTVSDAVGSVATVASGNPIAGAAVGASLLALFGAGASRLRKKKREK